MSDRNPGESLPVDRGGALECELSLSAAQLGIWFAQRIDPSSPAYNIGEYIEIHGSIDPLLFERALQEVICETEALRVRFVERAGVPKQIVGASHAWLLPIIDVSSDADPRAVAEAWMKADLAGPVDPIRGPMFGFALFKASKARSFWYARYHHLIMDAFGMWLVARRVAEIYTQLDRGATRDGAFGSLAALVEGDAAYRASEQFRYDRKYWLDQLGSRPEPGSLSLSGRPPTRSDGVHRSTAYLQKSTVEDFRSIAQRAGTSFARVIAAVTAIFQHRVTGATDLIFGFPVAGRDEVSRRIPGMVSNVLPLRLSVHPSMTISEVVDRTAALIGQGLEHRRYQLADMRRDIGGVVDDQGLVGLSINVMPFNYDLDFGGRHSTARNLSLGPVEDFSIAVYDRFDNDPVRNRLRCQPSILFAE